MAPWPCPTDGESVGDGGTAGESVRVGASTSSTTGGVFAAWAVYDSLLVSALLSDGLIPSTWEKDDRGLLDLEAPGILERMDPRNEREDSLVSDLLKDG